MEWLEQLESSLANLVTIVEFFLEAISVACVLIGLVKTIQLALTLGNRRYSRPFNLVRLRFGTWLALALEFQLGADILATTVTPTLEDLGKLALVAVIRTFLNYFLGKELETEYKLQKERTEMAVGGQVEE